MDGWMGGLQKLIAGLVRFDTDKGEYRFMKLAK